MVLAVGEITAACVAGLSGGESISEWSVIRARCGSRLNVKTCSETDRILAEDFRPQSIDRTLDCKIDRREVYHPMWAYESVPRSPIG